MPKPENKETIAVDVDDVLAANAEGFVKYSNRRWGTNLKPEDYDEHWAEMWKVDYEEEKKRSKELFSSDIVRNYRHFAEAEPVLKRLSSNYKLVVVTSRRHAISEDTRDWLDKHFKNIFSEIHFAGIWDELEKNTVDKLKATKAEICKQIGADYLIDDQLKHCKSAAEAGIKALLFGDYPWSKVDKLPQDVSRVKNWQEVLEYFDEKR